MRPHQLVLLLVLILSLAGAVIWLILQPPGGASPNIENSALASRNQPGTTEPRPRAGGNDASQPARNREERRTPKPPKPEPEATSTAWTVRGSVKMDPSAGVNPLAHLLPEDLSVSVRAYRGPSAPQEYSQIDIALQNDWGFSEEFAPEDLGLQEGESPVPLYWYVDFEPTSGDGFSVPDEDSDEERTDWQEPKGCLRVIPTVSGRTLDFGQVLLTLESMFPDEFVVTGRLVHTSGRTLCHTGNHALGVKDPGGEFDDWLYFGTDAQGRFMALLYADTADVHHDPASFHWNLLLRVDREGPDSSIRLAPPRFAGRLVDFGDISLKGSLLVVTVEMDPTPKIELRHDGTLAIDEGGYYQGEMASLDLNCGDLYFNEGIPPAPYHVTMMVPEGRYHWSVDSWSSELVYLPASGILDVPDNAVTSLKVSLKAAATVPVKVLKPDGTPAEGSYVTWSFNLPDDNGYSGRSEGPKGTVPVVSSSPTTCTAELEGFDSATGETKPGDTELVLQLSVKLVPDTGIEVRLPVRPQGVQLDGVFQLRLWIQGEVGQSDHWINLLVEEPGVLRFKTGAGTATVQLNGGCDWGYPAVISGPVNATVKEGEFTVVELPPIGPAPWAVRADKLQCRVRAGEQPVEIGAPFLYEDGTDFGDGYYTDGTNIECGALPAHLLDGDQKIAVEITPPTAEAPAAKLSIELPPRIEVRVKRRGVDVTNFHAEAWGKGDGMSRTAHCSGSTGSGAVSLWLPPGKASLTVELENFEHNQEVIVRRGEITRVDVELGHVRVEFVNPAEGVTSDDDLPRLRMFTIRDDGTLDPEMYDTIWGPEVKMLPPARYRMIPPAVAGAGSAFDLDLRAGGDRVIVLPALNTELVDVRLSFPMEFADAPNHYMELQLLPLTDPEQLRMSPEFAYQEDSLQWRFVPNGLLVHGVPKGVDVCLVGYFTRYEGEEEKTLILKPIRLRAQQDGEIVTAEWKKAVELHEEWQWIEIRYLSLVDGCALPFFDGAAGAMPGTHEVGFYADEKLVHREWVTFSGDGKMRFSASLRATLIEKQLVEAEMPEEVPEED
ncbi:MAG: hypothetical protein IPK87_13045 [Planctomycetes bacterium]|nr:hypothetical protein [Planctomycetota bacterium]